jgi:glycerol-3-phosphate O-acyltransferase
MATREGVCQAVFLEGGLSRDGRLQTPKLGLIDYMLRTFNPATDRDVVFIPVGINYDRTLEDRSLLRTLDPEAEKRGWWFVCRTTFKFVRRSLVLMLLNRWRRYGYACVNFGTPLSAKAYCLDKGLNFSQLPRSDRFPEIEKLCHRLMSAISEVVPVLPVSLLSMVFLESMNTELDILDIEERIKRLMNELQARGAPVFEMSRSSKARNIVDALDLMTLRHMVTASGDQFKAVSAEEQIMRYYANSIGHWRQHE